MGPERKILKFEVMDRRGRQVDFVNMPHGAVIRSVGVHNGAVFVWAECVADDMPVARMFTVYGTGAPILDTSGFERKYVGTAHDQAGGYVWHVFEVVLRA